MIELCFLITVPARYWVSGYAGAVHLTEEGEEVLNAVARAVDRALMAGSAREVLQRSGVSYDRDSWVTRWPGPAGDLVEVAGSEWE